MAVVARAVSLTIARTQCDCAPIIHPFIASGLHTNRLPTWQETEVLLDDATLT